MKRPTWATIVGVLGIIFGCFGILGAAQDILMPKMLEMQKEMFAKIQESTIQQKAPNTSDNLTESKDNCSTTQPFPSQMFDSMQKIWNLPDWFGTWSIITGVSKALISALYLLASIWLLLTKPSSIRLFYYAAGASILLCIAKGIVAFSTLSFMGMAMIAGGVFGALIDIVLIIVVATGNKAAFQVKPAEEPLLD